MLNEHREMVSELLNGNVPLDLEDLLEEKNISLFVKIPDDIKMSCTCPDYATPCKHIAAVFYIFAENFDTGPFLLLLLRGKNRQEIISAVSHSSREAENNKNPEIANNAVVLLTFWSGDEVKLIKIDTVRSNPLICYPLPDELNDPEIIKIFFEYYNNIRKAAEKMEDDK